MATIDYKCDTCRREIELLENKIGITTTSNCIITRNCHGNMYTTGRNPNNLRQSIPSYAANVDDYIPRKLFYEQKQTIPAIKWKIAHGFGASCVFVVYREDGSIVDSSEYNIKTLIGFSELIFTAPTIGIVHVLSRTGGNELLNSAAKPLSLSQVSCNDTITFAIPKFITRENSGADSGQTTLSTIPLNVCNAQISIEIELTKPNEPPIFCTETLDAYPAASSPWYNWPQILVKNRKHYCVRTKRLSQFKALGNTNSPTAVIPDGTLLRITKISYNENMILTNIPDRGLLILLASPNYSMTDKILDQLLDCGEMVDAPISTFSFKGGEIYIDENGIEDTYPKISQYRP